MTKRVHAKRATTRASAGVGKVSTSRAILAVATAAAAAAVGMIPAVGAADTWTGMFDHHWSIGDNWLDGTEPTSTDDVIFPNPVPATPGSNVLDLDAEFARSLTFNESYNLIGGGGSGQHSLEIATGSVAVAAGRTAIIEVHLNGTAGLLKSQAGTLMLGNSNGYSGGTTVTAGTLQFGDGGNSGGLVPGNITVNNLATLAFNELASTTINGTISGAGNLIKLAGNTVVLASNNTYTGGTTISAGILQIGNGGPGGSITGNVANSGTLIFNRSDDFTFGGAISGSGAVIKQLTNTFALTGNNTYSGVTTISAGTLQIGAGSTSGAIAGDVANSGTLSFNRSDNIAYGGVVSGSGQLVKLASNTLTLTGNNTYSGGTTISAGTLAVGNSAALGPGPASVVVNGGGALQVGDAVVLNRTISLNTGSALRGVGAAQSVGVHTVASGAAVTFGTVNAADVLNIGATSGANSLGGGGGGAVITVSGPGTVRLRRPSNFAGNWVLAAGTLDAGSDDRLGSGTLTLAGGTISYDGGGETVGRTYLFNGGGFNVVSGNLNLVGSLTSGAGGGFSKTGAGNLRVFSFGQTYGVGASINVAAGQLFMFTPAGSASAHNLTVNVNAGLFRVLEHDNEFLHGLNVADGALADYTPAGTGVIQVDAISTAGTGKFDLTSNKLIVKSPFADVGTFNGSAYTALTGMIASGRNGGSWSGGGIVTSSASGNFTTLAIGTASQVKGIATTATATWAGQTVTGTDALIMYTYGGDANLDGKINVDDYGRIDFNVNLGTAGWFNGDFNYDGKINVDDYGIIDFNVGIQGAPFPTSAGAGLSAISSVPEPASVSLVLVACGLALPRRRRRD